MSTKLEAKKAALAKLRAEIEAEEKAEALRDEKRYGDRFLKAGKVAGILGLAPEILRAEFKRIAHERIEKPNAEMQKLAEEIGVE